MAVNHRRIFAGLFADLAKRRDPRWRRAAIIMTNSVPVVHASVTAPRLNGLSVSRALHFLSLLFRPGSRPLPAPLFSDSEIWPLLLLLLSPCRIFPLQEGEVDQSVGSIESLDNARRSLFLATIVLAGIEGLDGEMGRRGSDIPKAK